MQNFHAILVRPFSSLFMLVYDNKRSSVRRILTVNCPEHVRFVLDSFCVRFSGETPVSRPAQVQHFAIFLCHMWFSGEFAGFYEVFMLLKLHESRIFSHYKIFCSPLGAEVASELAACAGNSYFSLHKRLRCTAHEISSWEAPMEAELSHLDLFRCRV